MPSCRNNGVQILPWCGRTAASEARVRRPHYFKAGGAEPFHQRRQRELASKTSHRTTFDVGRTSTAWRLTAEVQIDTTNLGGLLPADFEYSFDAPMGHDIPGVMALSGSMPSPAYPLSLLPNNLDDSGFALYIESESSPQRRRGSSEGNESGMPARSRRKAQNRAA